MGVPVTYVMTHDSIGLGEDGPTHQPVEQVASLRAMPNINVFRPADAVETAEAWEIAVMANGTPSIMALSRQGLPLLRTDHTEENLTAKGAYVLRDTDGNRDVTLIATGSEVEIAMNAADILAADGIKAAVVSAPCFELFAEQPVDYRKATLGTAPRVGIEALIEQGWGKMLGDNSAFIGMTGFGMSAPAGELYKKFGITADATAQAARDLLAN
ncbi:MAG: transketolase C-terminal domain-containing protein, partial [Paracoccaceae bacterium]